MELGLVATGKRNIRSGREYDRFFPKPQGEIVRLKRNGSVGDTLKKMEMIARKYYTDTTAISKVLIGKNEKETLKNVFDFCYSHIQYKLDKPGLEELRRPARAWADRQSGVDCDCYSIFISSILLNLGIPHKFRVTKYSGDWQHVYVVVPQKNPQGSKSESLVILDPVLDTFNYEKSFTDKHDHYMGTLGIPIVLLNGIEDENSSENLKIILAGPSLDDLALGSLGDLEEFEKRNLDAIRDYVKTTRDYLVQNPNSIPAGTAKSQIEMMNYLLENWSDPEKRERALDILEREEARMFQAGVSGLYDFDPYGSDLDGLGGLGGFFSRIKSGIQKVGAAVKTVAQNVATAAKNVAEKVVDVAKGAVKAIVRYNPVTAAVRGAYLLAIRMNLFRMAERLYHGLPKPGAVVGDKYYAPDGKVYNPKQALKEVELVFTKLGGKVENLHNAIRKGAEKKGLRGTDQLILGELGEITVATLIAAAAPIMATVQKLKQYIPQPATSAEEKEAEDLLDNGMKSAVTDDQKRGLLKKVVDWIKSKRGKIAQNMAQEEATGDQVLRSEEYEDVPPPASPVQRIPAPKMNFTRAGAASGEQKTTPEQKDETTDNPDQPSGLMSFIKENPGKTAAIGITLLGIGVLAFSSKARKAIGLGGTSRRRVRRKKKKGVSGVSGTRKSKKTTSKKAKSKSVRKIKLK